MIPNSIDALTAEIREAQHQVNTVQEHHANSAGKIAELTGKLESLHEQRDKLEKELATAGDKLLSGKMTDQDFSKNKARLKTLYTQIDEAESLLDAYTSANTQRDFSQKLANLNKRIGDRKLRLLRAYAEQLADELVKGKTDQIKRIMAALEADPSLGLLGYDPAALLGKTVLAAAFGADFKNGIKHVSSITPAERTDLTKAIFSEFGV